MLPHRNGNVDYITQFPNCCFGYGERLADSGLVVLRDSQSITSPAKVELVSALSAPLQAS